MKRFLFFLLTLSVLSASGSNVDFVNPFLGVDGGGNVLPGPSLPMSIIRINPMVASPQPTSGYLSGRPIIGFIQTNVSGTGGQSRYGNFLVTPQSGEIDLAGLASPITAEEAKVGYYKTLLVNDSIVAELTCTEKVGVQRFTFSDTGTNNILFTASSVLNTGDKEAGRCLDAYLDIHSDNTLSGYILIQGGWGHTRPYKLYFCAGFDTPFSQFGTWNEQSLHAFHRHVRGDNIGAYFRFEGPQAVTMKVAVSPLSVQKAREHLEATRSLDFDAVVSRAQRIWSDYLDKIDIETTDPDKRTLFYTSLYRTYIMPTDITGENPQWQTSEPSFWDYYCIWDTFRTSYPLITLLTPDKMVDLVRSLLDIYKHRGRLPDAWVVGDYGKQQGGTNADVVIADAMVKGLQGFDYQLAYEAVKNNAEEPTDETKTWQGLIYNGKHAQYLKQGYLTSDKLCSVSYTLEFAYNDFCMAQVAKVMGREKVAEHYLARSLQCYQLFDESTGFFWAKKSDGEWEEGFAPNHCGNPWWMGPYFYEGTPWHYSTYVLHDIEGLIARHKGEANFSLFLDKLFSGNNFTHENEPDIHAPYLYNYVGRPYRTAEVVDRIMNTEYANSRRGLPGNDDSGCMSSWYIFASMGFYPLAGQDIYLIGKPQFPSMTVSLPEGKRLVITARGVSDKNIYVQSLKVNGKRYDKSYITHKELAEGATLEFEMGPRPSRWATHPIREQRAKQ